MSEESNHTQSKAEDLELVKKCRLGDLDAFDQLVTKYRAKVYGMVFNMVKNEHDAWDMAQEGFIKVWKSIDQFKGEAAFSTWMYRVIRNSALDWLRGRSARRTDSLEAKEGMPLEMDPLYHISSEEGPMEALERAELRATIMAAMNELSEGHRLVIELKEMEGYSYQEIAEKLKISLGTVMSRLYYARRHLQRALEGTGGRK